MKRPYYEPFCWVDQTTLETRWGFNIVAANGEVTSTNNQGYESYYDCLRGIKANRKASRSHLIKPRR